MASVPKHVQALITARAVNQLGAFSLAFLTVLLSRDLGASLSAAGAVSALFGMATIPSRLLGGRLAERLGRRTTILIGLSGCAFAQLGIAASPNLAVAAFCAILLGLAFELYEPPSQAMIAESVLPGDRAATYALLTTALAVGNTCAGLIAVVVGHSGLRWLFVVDAATCLACALIVRLAIPADHPIATPLAEHTQKSTVSPWRDQALLIMTTMGTVYALIYMLTLVSMPLSLAANGANPADAGLIAAASTVTMVATRPLLRRPLASVSAAQAFAAGYALITIALIGFALAQAISVLLIPTVFWSVGNLLLMGRALALVSDLAPAGASARYLAVYGLSWGVATVTAPILGTWLIGSFGSATLWAAMAAVSLAMAVAQPCLVTSARPRTSSLVNAPR